ncbi:MAG TPA: GIDE domain-containing protein [Herpetosiphonaceae bacterium]
MFLIPFVIAIFAELSLVPPIQRWWRHWMQVRQTPVLPIDRVPDEGNIAITGQTQPAHTPEYAPLSKTPCVYWRVVLREQQGRRSSTTLSDRTSEHPFRLSDGEHGICIEPVRATLSLTGPGHHTWIMNDLAALEQLAQEGAVARRWQKTTWTTVSEVCIPVGEKVWVYGAVRTISKGKIVAAGATMPVLISNRPPRQLIWLYGWQWMVASVLLLALFLATIFGAWWVYQVL